MSLPHMILWAVVLAVAAPASFRNPTAGALALCYLFSEGLNLLTGSGLAVDYYIFPDLFVLAVIFAKPEACNYQPYENTWVQLKCLLIERSVPDRIVMLLFPVAWYFYVADIAPYYQWWALWWIAIAQFLAAGWEGFYKLYRSRVTSGTPDYPSGDVFRRLGAVAFAKSVIGGSSLADSDSLVKAFIQPQAPVLTVADAGLPALFLLTPRNAGYPARVVASFFSVPAVLCLRAIAQIRNAIVRAITVDVVDIFSRPRAVVHGPRNTVGIELLPENTDGEVASAVRRGSFLSGKLAIADSPSAVASEECARAEQPKEFARLRLIAEKLTKRFRGGYFSDSHCAVPSREGQGRAVLDAPFRPAFSSTDHAPTQRRVADADAMLVACEGRGYG